MLDKDNQSFEREKKKGTSEEQPNVIVEAGLLPSGAISV